MSDLHYVFVSYESSSEITMEVTNGDVRLIFHIRISLTPDVEKKTYTKDNTAANLDYIRE